MTGPASREQNAAYARDRVDGKLAKLRQIFRDGRIWRSENAPRNERNESLLSAYVNTVGLMQENHIPLRLLWQRDGIFDRIVDGAPRSISAAIAEQMCQSVQQMVTTMQRARDEEPGVAFIWPDDPTIYTDGRQFVGSREVENDRDQLAIRYHDVVWRQFGLDPGEDGSLVLRDGRSQGNNRGRRRRRPNERDLSPARQPETPVRRPPGTLPGAPRRDRRVNRATPFPPRQVGPRPRPDPIGPRPRPDPIGVQEPPARRMRLETPDTPTPPSPTRPVEVIDLVGEEEMVLGEEETVPQDPTLAANTLVEPGPSQPRPVETREHLGQQLRELQAQQGRIQDWVISNPLLTEVERRQVQEELQSISRQMRELEARLMDWAA